MYKVNDLVVHFRDGVAEVVGFTKIGELDYYLVKAKRGTGESIYVPISKAENIIRPLINVADAEKVLLVMKEATIELSPNTKQRRDSFKRRLSSGDPLDLAFLAKQLYLFEKQEVLGITVKFGPADLDMLRYAYNVLFDELAIVYKVDRNEISKFVGKKLDNL